MNSYQKTCAECGVLFIANKYNYTVARFCTNRCRFRFKSRNHRIRQKSSGLCLECNRLSVVGHTKCSGCSSGIPEAGMKTCRRCLDKDRQRFKKRKERGVCTTHPKVKALPGKTKCQTCAWEGQDRSLAKLKLTIEDYAWMEYHQNRKCAICKGTNKNGRNLAVDHDHKTNLVRGLLCDVCNRFIGAMGEDPERLLSAVVYLEYFRSRNEDSIDL